MPIIHKSLWGMYQLYECISRRNETSPVTMEPPWLVWNLYWILHHYWPTDEFCTLWRQAIMDRSSLMDPSVSRTTFFPSEEKSIFPAQTTNIIFLECEPPGR